MGPMERLQVPEEGITVTKPMNTVSLVESEPKKKKMSTQQNLGWRAIEEAKFYIGITVPNLKKKREKKRKEKKKNIYIYIYIYIYVKVEQVYRYTEKVYTLFVQLTQKQAVAKVYRYTLNVYRYNSLKNGTLGRALGK